MIRWMYWWDLLAISKLRIRIDKKNSQGPNIEILLQACMKIHEKVLIDCFHNLPKLEFKPNSGLHPSESLLATSGWPSWNNLQYIKSHCFWQGSAHKKIWRNPFNTNFQCKIVATNKIIFIELQCWNDLGHTCTGQWWHGRLLSHGNKVKCGQRCWSASSHT